MSINRILGNRPQATEETAMRPLSYHLARARVATCPTTPGVTPGPVPFPAPPRPFSPPWRAMHPLAASAPPAA